MGNAISAQLFSPNGIYIDATNNIYIGDYANNRIRKINSSNTITTVAGNGAGAYFGDGGLANSAGLFGPWGVDVDASNSLYIADRNNNVIRYVNSLGIINTIAGNGNQGFSGDFGLATLARLNMPTDVAVDALGNIYMCGHAE